MFIDKATIQVQSGAGGNGIVAWRREKYVPHGGPAGGDGGNGGDVYVEAADELTTLLDFRYQSIFKAGDGERGGNKNMHGKQGAPLTIKVPCGTIVRDNETGHAIADLVESGQRVLVAAGGRGGRGNARFLSSTRQAPQFAEPGEPSIGRTLHLELKLIAEVGIIGMPNAGKSTLISVISAAKPKIADYPFTTLVPNLGVVRKPDGHGLVVADIPGLVEGASEGVGLGHEFLRHVERTRLLLHLVDASQADATAHFDLINGELAQYSERLARKPQIVVLSKTDTVSAEAVEQARQALAAKAAGPVYAISAVTRQGLDELLHVMLDTLEKLPVDTEVVTVVPDLKAADNDDSEFAIYHRRGGVFEVTGGKITRLFSVTDMRNREAVQRLMNILRAMGVYAALEKAGAKEGQTIKMAGLEFDYTPDESEAGA